MKLIKHTILLALIITLWSAQQTIASYWLIHAAFYGTPLAMQACFQNLFSEETSAFQLQATPPALSESGDNEDNTMHVQQTALDCHFTTTAGLWLDVPTDESYAVPVGEHTVHVKAFFVGDGCKLENFKLSFDVLLMSAGACADIDGAELLATIEYAADDGGETCSACPSMDGNPCTVGDDCASEMCSPQGLCLSAYSSASMLSIAFAIGISILAAVLYF